MDEPAHLHATRSTYDAVAVDYARLLPDLRAETALDQAMLATFAELTATAGLGPVVDLGCGTGRITAHLDSLGVDTFGIDLSFLAGVPPPAFLCFVQRGRYVAPSVRWCIHKFW